MNHLLSHEIIRIGGDPSDEAWRWLWTRGPHGTSFTWSQTRGQPAGYVGVVQLEEIVNERSRVDPAFKDRAREVSNVALASELPDLVRRAVQVLGVVGGSREKLAVNRLVDNPHAEIAADARACIFYLKKKRV